jgi:nitronate monooxygenase
MRAAFADIRAATARPINANFFLFTPAADPAREAAWRARLAPHYAEHSLDPDMAMAAPAIPPFGEAQCDLIAELKPEIVSFHCGLPEQGLVERIKASGSKIISSATTAEEARWLEARGCDAIIAQGAEAGGHRAMFLPGDVSAQPGLMALLPQIVDAVTVPVIAAGGIADGRGIAAAFALGAGRPICSARRPMSPRSTGRRSPAPDRTAR